mgnify:CR=1 FL=1
MASILKPMFMIGSLILACAGITMPAEAQVPGSYLNSCRNITYKHLGTPKARIVADCQRRDGSWKPTKLDIADCRGDIANDNGNLVCIRGGGGGFGPLPRGSWKMSCRDGRMVDGMLIANCQKRNGKWTLSSIRIDKCRGDIANDNGRLVCDRGREWQLPPGSWKMSCRDATVVGNRLYADCRRMNGKWRETEIRLDRCRGPIANMDGRLVCE